MSLFNGDCFEVMQGLADNSVDLVLTDPPYGLKFMGKKWDCDVPRVDIWAEALRVLKPGGHVLAFAGTRTQHRMACNIEDAGFEIRDMLAWVYGSGFPKSLDVSKAIDKAAGITEWKETTPNPAWRKGNGTDAETSTGWAKPQRPPKPVVETDAAREWAGYGTALKPALEPITMARKPLVGTVAANVLEYGTGALNIDACRVGTDDNLNGGTYGGVFGNGKPTLTKALGTGRWPANLLHDGSEEVLALFPMTGKSTGGCGKASQEWKSAGHTVGAHLSGIRANAGGLGDSGSAARFFYCAKASKRERDAGCEGMEKRMPIHGKGHEAGGLNVSNSKNPAANHHPTVKPIALMEYLVQLASHPGAVVLDPFMGSGTTGIACRNLGREFIGIERDADYFEIAKRRIEHEAQQMELPA